jgi:hypothetical protein
MIGPIAQCAAYAFPLLASTACLMFVSHGEINREEK